MPEHCSLRALLKILNKNSVKILRKASLSWDNVMLVLFNHYTCISLHKCISIKIELGGEHTKFGGLTLGAVEAFRHITCE